MPAPMSLPPQQQQDYLQGLLQEKQQQGLLAQIDKSASAMEGLPAPTQLPDVPIQAPAPQAAPMPAPQRVQAQAAPQQSLRELARSGSYDDSRIKQTEDDYFKGLDERKRVLSELKTKLSDLQGKEPTGIDAMNLKPLAAFVDSMTGSHIAQSVDEVPQGKKDWKEKVKALQDAVGKQSNELSDDQLGYIKAKIGDFDKQFGAAAKMDFYDAMKNNRMAGLNLREDALAMRAGQNIDKDNMITTALTQNQNLEKAQHTLQSGMITPQLLSEIEMDMAAALSGKGAATDHVRKSVEMGAWDRKLAELRQLLTSSPQGVNMPEYAQYLHSVIERLKEANNLNIQNRTKAITAGAGNISSQKVKNVINSRVKQLNQSAGPQEGDIVDGHEFLGGDPADPANWVEAK